MHAPGIPPFVLERCRARVDDLHELTRLGLVPRHGQFFPAGIHYPPITMVPEAGEELFLAGYEPPADGRFVLYVHVPFCARVCTYCHYPVHTGSTPLEREAYLDLLDREFELWRARLGLDRIRVHSALVAGGTPSLLEPRLFRRLHEIVLRHADLSEATQLSYDVHPLDLLGADGAERLAVMREYGSDRLTIGLQTMDDRILKHMNRGHGVREAEESVAACRRAGFEDICVEFIFGYPGQDLALWVETLYRAIALDVEEIQLYRLKVAPYGDAAGSILRIAGRRPEAVPPAEAAIEMKEAAIALLAEHGYRQNLTRVFTKERRFTSDYATDQCCRLRDTIGVGTDAFSSFRDRFCIHAKTIDEWAALVEAGRLPVTRAIVRDRDASLRWHLLLPLKNDRVIKGAFRLRTGEDAGTVFRRELDLLAAHGLLYEDDEEIRLTERGRFFADEICIQLGHPRYLPFARQDYADGPLFLSRPLDPPAAR